MWLSLIRFHSRARHRDCKADSVGRCLMGKALGSCKGKGGSIHIADVDQGMLGANDIGTLAVAVG
jgi:TPP-dependent pyruvate/acetoin dehydrogenase alpha subunit